jgi:putative transposase
MPKPTTPSFILELPLVVQPEQARVMAGRFECARRLCNAVLGDALNRLDLMRQSKAWQGARLMPRGMPRTQAFASCNKHFKFTEYDLQAVTTRHKNAAGYDDRLGAHETQKIATRIFKAVQQYAFGKSGRPRFKGAMRPLRSLEGKTNAAGIRWQLDTGCLIWNKLTLPVRVPSKYQDPYVHAALAGATKYCRIVWRMEHGHKRWFVQLVQEGNAPDKYEFLSDGQTVGLDIGPSTVAIVADEAVALERFVPSVNQPWKQMRLLQRAQDRSRRICNPDNFNANGTAKKGVRKWAKSARYKTRQTGLAELERKLSAARKRDHGELVNKILGLGNCIQTEKLSYKAWQKNFGRSAKVRASGAFVSLLTRKAESAGGKVVELNTRTLKMSQYDHRTGVCTKKPLSQRWHDLGNTGSLVQRDCYSAFLAKNVMENQHKPTLLNESWAAAEPLLRRAGLCVEQSESGIRLRVPTVVIPSDRIARQRRFVRGYARDVVVDSARMKREPGNPSQSAFRTPGL